MLATVYAMNYEELRAARQTPFERPEELDEFPTLELHHVLAGAQERFVLAHELAHYAARVEPAAFSTLVQDMLVVLRGWVRARGDLVVDPAVFDDQYTKSIEEAWERRHGPLDEEFKRTERERYQTNRMSPTPGEHAAKVLHQIESNGTLRVEVACDTVAMLAVMFSARPQTLTSDVAGSALALHHLRLLQLIDDCAEDNPDGASASLNIQESATRLTAFRACVSGFASVAFGEDSGVAELLHEQITEVNLTHSTVVGDQYLFHTQQKFRDLLDATRQKMTDDSVESTEVDEVSGLFPIEGVGPDFAVVGASVRG